MQNSNTEDVMEIDLKEVFGVLLHRAWMIILCGILAGVIGFLISNFLLTPMYQSTTKVYILNKQENSTLTYSDVQLGTQLTKDYQELIKSRYVLEQVIDAYSLSDNYEAFSDKVSVTTPTDTRIISITVEDASPVMAQRLADEIRTVASEHIKNVMDIQAVNTAEEANLPVEPSSPSVMKWTVIAAAIGIFISAGIILVFFLLDDTIKTADDVEKYLELSTLALIPVAEGAKKDKKKKSVRFSEVNATGKSLEYRSDANRASKSSSVSEVETAGGTSAGTTIEAEEDTYTGEDFLNDKLPTEDIEVEDLTIELLNVKENV